MEKLGSINDSELIAWASSFSGAADSNLYPTRDHVDYRQHSQGLSSQSLSYQPSQLTFLSSADDRPSASPHLLSNSMEKDASQHFNVMPTPPSLSSAQSQQQPSQQQAPPARTNQYTVTSISTAAGVAGQQQQQQQPRSAEGKSSSITATSSRTHRHIRNGEVQTLPHSSSSTSTLPRHSKMTPAAVAAATAAMNPLCVSHPSGTGDTDMGGDMEVKGERLEDYLDLQDDDGDSDDAGVGCMEGSAAYPGQQTSDLPHSCSQHLPLSRANDRNSLWMSDLCTITGDVGSYNNNHSNDNSSTKHSHGKRLSHSPCTPIEVDMLSVGNYTNNVSSDAANADVVTMPINPCTGPVKKAQPPPLSGFTPVAATVCSFVPRENKANNVNANRDNHSTSNNINSTDHSNGVQSNRSTTPQLLSLVSSSKASPPSHKGLGALIEEERRLKEEMKLLCQRLFDTEQRLARVQRRIAESSFNGAATVGTMGWEGQRSIQPPPLQATTKITPAESRPLDTTAAATATTGAGTEAETATPSNAYMVSSSTASHYVVGASSMERWGPPPQQQQHMTSSSTNSRVYMSNATSSASVAMTHPAPSDSSGPTSNGMTYFVQNSSPFGVYATPSAGTQVDAAGNAIQTNGACTTATTVTNAAAAMFSAPPQSVGSAVQVLGAQSYMVNNQPTICYMVLTPQAQQPLPPPQQQQQLTASGVFSASVPPPEFGSNNNINGGGGNPHMKGAALTHMPVLTTTSLTAAAAIKTPEVLPSYPHIVMVGPASNGELTRKCFNVHGSMVGVVPYFPYDESAPPAPTATILTSATSPNASILGQPISGAGWSMRSISGGGADVALGNSSRSHDGLSANDCGVLPPRSCDSNSPPNHAKSSPPTAPGDLSTAPVLPIFIQMFPCELHDRATVLNRVIEATCGRDFGAVQRIEPRSETSFIAHVRTHQVWQLIYKLRCRVLMDRFGLWYAADFDQYVRMKEYCEGVRRLPQQTRHFQTDGLPCMPLVVELSRMVDKAVVTENDAPRTFDEIVPMVAVDRHRTRLPSSATATSGMSGSVMPNTSSRGGSVIGFAATTAPTAGVFTEANMTNGESSTNSVNHNHATPMLASVPPQHWGMRAATPHEVNFLASGSSLGGSTRAGQPVYTEARPPPHLFM